MITICIYEHFLKADFESRNLSTDIQLENDTIMNDRFEFHILDHPMKPFGMRYWENYDYYMNREEFLEYYSFQACSWIRDQEYLVDFKYYENLHHSVHGYSDNYLHMFGT